MAIKVFLPSGQPEAIIAKIYKISPWFRHLELQNYPHPLEGFFIFAPIRISLNSQLQINLFVQHSFQFLAGGTAYFFYNPAFISDYHCLLGIPFYQDYGFYKGQLFGALNNLLNQHSDRIRNLLAHPFKKLLADYI